MDGIAVGNWEFVIAAWGISLSLLASYSLLVVLRLKAAGRARSKGPS